MSKLSIIIVTYNSADYIERCLQSVFKAAGKLDYQVIVVDNSSSDVTLDIVREFKNIKVLKNNKNLGFAKACNQAIEQAESEFVILLNPDVYVTPDFIQNMIIKAQEDERIGSVSGKLYFAKTNGEFTNILYSTGHIFFKTCHSVNRGYGEVDNGQYNNVQDIFGVCGAAPLYRRAMLEDVKINDEYFDANFFLYREDEDLDWRAKLRGWHAVFEPRAVAYHVASEMRNKPSLNNKENKIRNRHLLLFKNLSVTNYFILMPYLIFYEIISFLVHPLAYFVAMFKSLILLINFPAYYAKRKIIMKRRLVIDREVRQKLLKINLHEIKNFFFRQRLKKLGSINT